MYNYELRKADLTATAAEKEGSTSSAAQVSHYHFEDNLPDTDPISPQKSDQTSFKRPLPSKEPLIAT